MINETKAMTQLEELKQRYETRINALTEEINEHTAEITTIRGGGYSYQNLEEHFYDRRRMERERKIYNAVLEDLNNLNND